MTTLEAIVLRADDLVRNPHHAHIMGLSSSRVRVDYVLDRQGEDLPVRVAGQCGRGLCRQDEHDRTRDVGHNVGRDPGVVVLDVLISPRPGYLADLLLPPTVVITGPTGLLLPVFPLSLLGAPPPPPVPVLNIENTPASGRSPAIAQSNSQGSSDWLSVLLIHHQLDFNARFSEPQCFRFFSLKVITTATDFASTGGQMSQVPPRDFA